MIKDGKAVREEIQDFNEALCHVYKEVIDNCADNSHRQWSSPQTYIDIVVNDTSIEVVNDGKPIAIEKEDIDIPNEALKKIETLNLYRTQALFSHFRTGTNAENGETTDSIGQHGIGAKATIGVSRYVKIHHSDPDNQKQLTIEYKDRMSYIGEPVIKPYTKAKSFTSFYYEPDFSFFGLKKFSKNHIGIFHAMAYCLAYISGCKVTFNGDTLKIGSIKQLGEMFFGKRQSLLLTNDNGDEVLVMEQSLEEAEEHGLRFLSFVNGSYTRNGGNHVNYNANKICKTLADAYSQGLKEKDVKQFLILIVNYKIKGKLQWSGQTKAALTFPTTGLKRIDVEKKDMLKLKKWAVWGEIARFLEGKTNRDANKSIKTNKTYIGSLGKNGVDANKAGTKESKKCKIFLCEGLSAKTIIDSGAKYLGGSDYVGVLALQGKISNVMKMDRSEQTDKKFLQLIRQMIGLKMGCKYLEKKECDQLRYGQIIICCDEDYDGYHITALVYVCFKTEHPGLIEHGIVSFLETPVIRTTINKQIHRFFLRCDFDNWLKELTPSEKNQAVENCFFLKGIGSNDPDLDAKYIFKEKFFLGQLTFKKQRDLDLMEIFFGDGKDCVKQKKEFMAATFYNDEWIHLPKNGTMSFSEFVEYRLTGCVDEQIHRAIPYLDGLKESFKDILWTAFHHLKGWNKTDSFALDVAKHSSYSHGGGNICPTVTKLAGNIIGVNNITIFKGLGGFGNRYVSAEDHHGAAAGRYTSISLQPIIRKVFMEEDDAVLEYIEKDGEITSPEYYLPIIPWAFVNGCPSSPGNAYSTNFPPYNPEDLVVWIRHWVGESFETAPKGKPIELIPWFRGFRGTVEKYPNGWLTKGILIQNDKNTWTVDEIAAGAWGVKLQTVLETLADEKKIEKPRILNENKNTIRAIIQTKTDFDVEKSLKAVLEHRYPMTNITCIHSKSPVTTNNIEEHLDVYARRRYKGYQDRRKHMMNVLSKQLKIKEDKIKFIKYVLSGEIVFKKIKDREELIELLLKLGFVKDETEKDNWKHITSMTFLSCTQKGIDVLEKEKDKVEKEYTYYADNKPWKIWLDDLDAFMAEYPKYLKDNPMNEEN
jgi:DNA topoisomerase-2